MDEGLETISMREIRFGAAECKTVESHPSSPHVHVWRDGAQRAPATVESGHRVHERDQLGEDSAGGEDVHESITENNAVRKNHAKPCILTSLPPPSSTTHAKFLSRNSAYSPTIHKAAVRM